VSAPAGYVERRDGDLGVAVVRADLAELPWSSLSAGGGPLPAARGRGAGVAVLELRPGLRAVARTYRRGGALSGVLREQFLDPLRPRRELEVLVALRAAGVSVVEPLAALSMRDGALWRLRLLTVLVDGALPLPAFVAALPGLRRAVVVRAGRVAADAFAAGLRHRDLHPDNLIATSMAPDPPAVFLLDLDRARLRPPVTPTARLAMLTRMARYLVRHRDSLPTAPTHTDAFRFLRGMGLDRAERRDLARTIEARLRRQLMLRRWLWR